MEKYIFIKDATLPAYDMAGDLTTGKNISLKKGDIVDGWSTTDSNGSVRITIKTSRGEVLKPIIAVDVELYKGITTPITNSTKTTAKSIFTPANIIIGIVIISAVFGILKWQKII